MDGWLVNQILRNRDSVLLSKTENSRQGLNFSLKVFFFLSHTTTLSTFHVYKWVQHHKYLWGRCEPLSPFVQLVALRLYWHIKTQALSVREMMETVWCSQEEAMTTGLSPAIAAIWSTYCINSSCPIKGDAYDVTLHRHRSCHHCLPVWIHMKIKLPG